MILWIVNAVIVLNASRHSLMYGSGYDYCFGLWLWEYKLPIDSQRHFKSLLYVVYYIMLSLGVLREMTNMFFKYIFCSEV